MSTPTYIPHVDHHDYSNDAVLDWSGATTVELALSGPENKPATGAPEISGTPQVGQTLTAEEGTLADDGGLPTTFPTGYTFQWYRVDADGTSNKTEIAGADSFTYMLAPTEEGKRFIVEVGFIDDAARRRARWRARRRRRCWLRPRGVRRARTPTGARR